MYNIHIHTCGGASGEALLLFLLNDLPRSDVNRSVRVILLCWVTLSSSSSSSTVDWGGVGMTSYSPMVPNGVDGETGGDDDDSLEAFDFC